MTQHNDIRQVVDPIYGPTSANAPVDAGGTSATNAADAAAALSILQASQVDNDNGVAPLDASKYIPANRFSSLCHLLQTNEHG